MKKLLACLLLALPLTASADYEAGKRLYKIYDFRGLALTFCRDSTGICWNIQLSENDNSLIVMEVMINGKNYRGIPDACATYYYCRDMFISASRNLKKAVDQDFDDIVVGDYISNQHQIIYRPTLY